MAGMSRARSAKMTRALAQKLAKSKGSPVQGVVFAAIDTEKLPSTSFAARAAARNKEVQDKLSGLVARIQEWETSNGQPVALEVRPDDVAVAVTAPPDIFRALAEDDLVAGVDVDPDAGSPA